MAAWGVQTADTPTPLDCPTARDQRRVAFVEFDSLRRVVNVRREARLPRHTWTGPVSMTDRILPAGSVNHAIGVPRCGIPSGGGSCSIPLAYRGKRATRWTIESCGRPHAAWLERAEPHAIGPTRTTFVTGLESWFTLPGPSGTPPPPPYKMALLTWITIFPLITGTSPSCVHSLRECRCL
jgi:hypothetical protein